MTLVCGFVGWSMESWLIHLADDNQTPFWRASIPIIHKMGVGEMSGSKERNVGNDLGNWGRILLANLSIHS